MPLGGRKARFSKSPTHIVHPDSGRGCSEAFDLAEEPLDEVAVSVDEWTEPGNVHAVRHRFDVGPGTAVRQFGSQRVTVVGAIREQHLTFADLVEHVAGAAAVMRLAFRQLNGNRVAVGIDKSVDLGGQPAPRARQWTKRLEQVVNGPYRLGMSAQGEPVRIRQ